MGHIMTPKDIASRVFEFEEHIWDHTTDPFQLRYDERAVLTTNEITELVGVIELFRKRKSTEEIAQHLRSILQSGRIAIELLLQVCGLTRNKILQDLKAAVTSLSHRISIPSSYERLKDSDEAWRLAGPYLVERLRRSFEPLAKKTDIPSALEALNQATWPGYIRQQRAKEQGHEAEYRLAVMMRNAHIPFAPFAKSENPKCPDAQINGVSFDLVIPNISTPKLCFKSTVHTANIGQYGESKDYLEIHEAHAMIEKSFTKKTKKPILMALIDGVGFRSNTAGLHGVLRLADEFCQFSSIWKAIVVAASRMGQKLQIYLPATEITKYDGFFKKYHFKKLVHDIERSGQPPDSFKAGDAFILPLEIGS
jgi:hypothetical protein